MNNSFFIILFLFSSLKVKRIIVIWICGHVSTTTLFSETIVGRTLHCQCFKIGYWRTIHQCRCVVWNVILIFSFLFSLNLYWSTTICRYCESFTSSLLPLSVYTALSELVPAASSSNRQLLIEARLDSICEAMSDVPHQNFTVIVLVSRSFF